MVPEQLEEPIGEPQNEDVLHRLLAEVMVDPVYLLFVEDAPQRRIERAGRFEIVAERLLHDDARPGRSVAPMRQP